MTSTIVQNVVPRRRGVQYQHRFERQRGSINSTTVTLMLGLVIIIAVTTLSFFYLSQVQDTAVQGSDIHTLEEQIVELRERQRSLELEGAELRSIRAIEGSVPELNLEAAEHVSYLTPSTDRVAARTIEAR